MDRIKVTHGKPKITETIEVVEFSFSGKDLVVKTSEGNVMTLHNAHIHDMQKSVEKQQSNNNESINS